MFMSEIKPNKNNQKLYTTETLEDGEPVYCFDTPGVKLDITKALDDNPTGIALVRATDGSTIAIGKTSAVVLARPSDTGTFSKPDQAKAIHHRETYSEGIPEITVGEEWVGGEVERVAFAPGDAYAPNQLSPDAPTPGMNLFASARSILAAHDTKRP